MKDLRKKAKKKVSHLMHLLIEQYGENVDQRFINAQWIRQGGKRAKEATEDDLEKKWHGSINLLSKQKMKHGKVGFND